MKERTERGKRKKRRGVEKAGPLKAQIPAEVMARWGIPGMWVRENRPRAKRLPCVRRPRFRAQLESRRKTTRLGGGVGRG